MHSFGISSVDEGTCFVSLPTKTGSSFWDSGSINYSTSEIHTLDNSSRFVPLTGILYS